MTRSAWLGIIIGLILFFILFIYEKLQTYYTYQAKSKQFNIKIKLKKLIIISTTLLLLITGFIFITPFKTDLKNRIQETFTFSHDNQAIHQRILIWKSALAMFSDHKFIGVGWGLFEANFPFYQKNYLKIKPYSRYRTHANNCHNEILEILTQTGIIGFIFYLAFFISLFILVFKTLKNQNQNIETKQKIRIIAYTCSIIGMLIDNLLNVSLHFATPVLIFWFIIASLIMELKTNIKTNSQTYGIKSKILFITICIIFLIFSISQIRFLVSEIKYFKGFSIFHNTNNPTPNTFLRAKKYLESSKKFHKYEANKLYELANVSAKIGMFENAALNYQEAISANPGYDEIYFNLGLMLMKQNKFQQAKQYLKISRKINPLNTSVILTQFNIALNEKNINDSKKYLLEALELEPKNYIITNNLGAIYSIENNFKEAIKLYNKTLELNNNYDIAIKNLKRAADKKTGILVPFKFEIF